MKSGKVLLKNIDVWIIYGINMKISHIFWRYPIIPSSFSDGKDIGIFGFPLNYEKIYLKLRNIDYFPNRKTNFLQIIRKKWNIQFFFYLSDSCHFCCFSCFPTATEKSPLNIIFIDISTVLDKNLSISSIEYHDAHISNIHGSKTERFFLHFLFVSWAHILLQQESYRK